MPLLTIDGRRIAYDDSGGSGVPVVLLHGFPLDRAVWEEQMPALAARRVIRVDLRGCGESEPSDGPALMESLAADVAGVLDALQVERTALAGHSIGGYVALAFFRMFAERVSGLALVASHVAEDAGANPSAAPAQRELAAARDAQARRLEAEDSMDAAIESYLPRYFAPRVYRDRPDLVERARAMMARQNPRGCAQLVRGMQQRLDSHDLLEDIGVPALVIAGGADSYLDARTLRETASAIRGAEFVLLEDAGHLPQWEAPERTADALASFAQRVQG
jgi:pimeloyl-ACP methyl ester carboxylesterase